MKLIIAIVQDQDVMKLVEALLHKGYRATKLASTGGFLKKGNTTLLVGVDDDRVEDVVDTVRNTCRERTELLTPLGAVGRPPETYIPSPIEVPVGGGTLFVLDVVRFEKV